MERGTRLHFHEMTRHGLAHRFVVIGRNNSQWRHAPDPQGKRLQSRRLIPTDETRAMYEWLRGSSTRALEMVGAVSVANPEAVGFRVLRP